VLLWLLTVALAAPHPAGEPLDDVVGVQLTERGLSALSGAVAGAVPLAPTALPPTSDAAGFGCFNYAYSLTGAVATVEVDRVRLLPRPGRLDVAIDLTVALNDASSPFLLQTELFCAKQDCPGYVDPFPVTAIAPVALSVVPDGDGRRVDVTVGRPTLENGLESSDVHLDCAIGTVERVLDAVGLSLVELIVGAAEDQLLDALTDPLSDLEVQLEEALRALTTDQTIDVGGVPVRIWTEPSLALVTEGGLTLGLMLGADTTPDAACVLEHEVGTFDAVASEIPPIAALGAVDAGILLGDGALHPILHAAWRGGLLCQRIDDAGGIGVPLDTSLLGALGGDPFRELFPVARPIVIETDPRRAPTVRWSDGEAALVLEDLGVDLFAELDGRMARAVGVTVGAEVVARPTITDGRLDLALEVAEDRITVVATGNELAPSTSPQIEAGLGELLSVAVGSLLGDALGGFSVGLPAIEGQGLTDLTVGAGGADGDWGVVAATLGPVEGGGAGCDGGGDEGCEGGGCATSGAGAWGLGALGLLVARRRRRDPGRR
jgi:MYXO-CTERM domain-containing protein